MKKIDNKISAKNSHELTDSEQTQIRKSKRDVLIKSGAQSYQVTVNNTISVDELRKKYVELDQNGNEVIGNKGSDYENKPVLKLNVGQETDDQVSICGRIMFLRDAGKLAFVALQSGSGKRIQAMLSAANLANNPYVQDEDKINGAGVELDAGGASLKFFKRTADLGDFLNITGKVISSKRGELSILVDNYLIASKALRPLPVLHKELNEESRVRRRYVDLIVNDKARNMVKVRSEVVKSLRKNFDERDYIEIETPMLQVQHGGASARPFVTHMNAFDIDLYLRIAPELFLKRAVVGGIDRVFEINRNFRNEGADRSHSPEFAMLEAYQAYADYNIMADITQNLVQKAALDVFGSLIVNITDEDGNDIQYSFEDDQWERITMYGSLSDALKQNSKVAKEVTVDTDIETLLELAKEVGLEKDVLGKDQNGNPLPPPSHGKLVELIWEHYIGDHLYKPTFVMDFPVETSPLTRDHRSKKGLVEKWDLYVRGFELATAYSELVDPVIQRQRLEKQSILASGGDEEAMQLDEDFLEALEYGMPPTGGMGMGIDRLLIALTGGTIRDTITFPLVKPNTV